MLRPVFALLWAFGALVAGNGSTVRPGEHRGNKWGGAARAGTAARIGISSLADVRLERRTRNRPAYRQAIRISRGAAPGPGGGRKSRSINRPAGRNAGRNACAFQTTVASSSSPDVHRLQTSRLRPLQRRY